MATSARTRPGGARPPPVVNVNGNEGDDASTQQSSYGLSNGGPMFSLRPPPLAGSRPSSSALSSLSSSPVPSRMHLPPPMSPGHNAGGGDPSAPSSRPTTPSFSRASFDSGGSKRPSLKLSAINLKNLNAGSPGRPSLAFPSQNHSQQQRRGSDAGSTTGSSDYEDDFEGAGGVNLGPGPAPRRPSRPAFDGKPLKLALNVSAGFSHPPQIPAAELDDDSSNTATMRPSMETYTPRRQNPSLSIASSGASNGGRETPMDLLRGHIREDMRRPSGDFNGVAGSENGSGGSQSRRPSAPRRAFEDFEGVELERMRRLGEGASGAVFLVRDPSARVMAMKIIPANDASADTKQLLREYQSLARCQHQNITDFYGAMVSNPESTSASEIRLMMEYCEGGSLESVSKQIRKLGRGPVSEKVVGKIATGILKGLDYLHFNKIIHRDIKPSNVLLSRSGVVKLCDFGVAGDLVGSVAETFTGTAYYMAPERIQGLPYTMRSDVWSTGLSLLEFAQNRFPYPPDLPAIDMLSVIVRGPAPSLEDDSGMWSAAIKNFIQVCLNVDAATRPLPRDMLKHPWITEQASVKISMERWIREVWGWEKVEKPPRSREHRRSQHRRSSTRDGSIDTGNGSNSPTSAGDGRSPVSPVGVNGLTSGVSRLSVSSSNTRI